MPQPAPEHQTILDGAWKNVVGSLDWLKSVLFGEFSDHRTLSAIVADMLLSFVPGVVIVTSARDAIAVILRLARHPEKREELMEWVLLSACLIVIALPLALAAGGAIAAGVGAVVGGIAGSELGAALRAVMLMLIKEASKLVELVRFLQKFIKGDVLKFLRAVKFSKYEKPLIQSIGKFIGKLVYIVKSLRVHLENLKYFDNVKAAVAKLIEWEKNFYAVQQDALKQIPEALVELDARLGKVLAQTAPKETHAVSTGVQAEKKMVDMPITQHVRDTPGKVLSKIESSVPAEKAKPKVFEKKINSQNLNPPKSEIPLKDAPEPLIPHEEGVNTKKQATLQADAASIREQAEKISEKVGADIKNHPLRQAYEAEVAGLGGEAEAMAKSGATEEEIARTMWARRRELGVKYKNVSPEPLREYIYEVNTARYKDPLGPSFENLVRSAEKKMQDPYQTIIDSSSRPNSDINGLLSKFGDWLNTKDSSYLDEALKKMEM